MPDPNTLTPADTFVWMNQRHGRPVPMLNEILRLLKLNLPTHLAYANTTYSYQLKAPVTYDYANARLPTKFAPAILVAMSVNTQEMGSGHADNGTISVFCAYEHGSDRRDMTDSLDTITICRGILTFEEIQGPHVDPDGRIVWNSLNPAGISTIPRNWPEFAGYAYTAQFHQTPGSSLWIL